jgi:hypothetical protein
MALHRPQWAVASIFFGLALCLLLLLSMEVPVSAKKRPPSPASIKILEPADHPVHALERGLVSERVTYRSIITEHSRHWSNTTAKRFPGSVLGYVTPWYICNHTRFLICFL